MLHVKLKMFGFLLILFLCSCQQNKPDEEGIILSVNLDQRDNVSLLDLFEKIELIPLETKEASLIHFIRKVVSMDNIYYIFDSAQDILLCFDENGKFIRQISKKGNGPGEYAEMSDFSVGQHFIKILQPWGIVYTYDKEGHWQETLSIKGEAKNYQYFIDVDNNKTLFWSFAPSKEDYQLFLYSGLQKKYTNSYYKDRIELDLIAHHVFHSFDGKVFFHKPFYNEIFCFENNELKVACSWDFGEKTMDIRKYDIPIPRNSQDILEQFRNSKIPYHYDKHAQTDLYYYAGMIIRFEKVLHVIYDKKNNKSKVFRTFSEGLEFLPVYWCNDYVIGTHSPVSTIDKIVNEDVLDDTGKLRLREIREDDNPCLIKYYFKKNE